MKSCQQRCLASLLFFLTFSSLFAQEQRAFNQNASRSNHTRAFNQNPSRSNHGLSISFSPVYSLATNNSSDSLLFRGSGAGFQFGADYFFGKAGISFSSGFGSSSPDDATINNFLKRFPFSPDELILTKARQQNMYMLLGPSVRFGSAVQLYAHAKGGLFINNSGLVSIQRKGAQRAVYRNESTAKSIYPGFLTGLRVQYSTKSEVWSFGIGADYMNTRSEVNNYDERRGGGIEPLKLSRNIADIVTGITIRYNILSARDQSSGQSTGKRSREAGSGMATGKRTYQPGQPVYGNITRQAATTESCGAVTQRTTNPDGTTEEMTFACPEDAVNYSKMKVDGGMPNRISMNVTVPKQTQGATFGEKVNQGLHAAGSALAQGASRNIISGRLSWIPANSTGIVTNKSAAVSSVGSLSGGGGAAAASYAATGRVINPVPGVVTTIYAREAGSGMATGKRSKDASSGMATGRRQYEPFFAEGQGDVCNPCIATAKMSGAHNNPLYEDKGQSGSNPMHEGKKAGGDDDCDGMAGMSVSLADPYSGAVIAKTITESCGDFFFANVPDGNYVIRVSGSFTGKKSYDVNTTSKTDLLGKVEQGDESVQLLINTGNDDNEMTQKAGISTSRSNVRTKSLTIIEADLDGDGNFESIRVLAELNDGTTRDITAISGISTTASVKKVTVRGWNPEKKQAVTGSANAVKEYIISIDADNGAILTSQYDNGKKEEAKVIAKVSHHPNVIQYSIPLADTDNDIWSPRSHAKILRLVAADVDGDGIPETTVAAPFVPGGAVISAATRPGTPIGGIIVKGGKNPGGNLRTVQTDEHGEFEFAGLEAGNYTFTMEQKVFIEDETFVSTGNTTRVQDHNSSRSNKTASVISNETGGGNNNTKVQDHNSSRSNKSASVVAGDIGNISADAKEPVTFHWTPLVPKPKEPVTYRLKVWQLMQGQNGSQARQSNQPIVEKMITNATETTVAGILTGPCKPPYLCDFIWSVQAINKDGSAAGSNQEGSFSVDQPQTKIQNNNTVKSNRTELKSILIEADLDGDGEYETDVTNQVSDDIAIDESGQATAPQMKAGISTSRSNIRTRGSLQAKGDGIYVSYGNATLNNKSAAVKILYSAKAGKTGSTK